MTLAELLQRKTGELEQLKVTPDVEAYLALAEEVGMIERVADMLSAEEAAEQERAKRRRSKRGTGVVEVDDEPVLPSFGEEDQQSG